jgi:hypothetical protein
MHVVNTETLEKHEVCLFVLHISYFLCDFSSLRALVCREAVGDCSATVSLPSPTQPATIICTTHSFQQLLSVADSQPGERTGEVAR